MSNWPEELRRLHGPCGSGRVTWAAADYVEKLEADYQALLMEVSHKAVGETRHETALRFIRERDAQVSTARDLAAAKAMVPEGPRREGGSDA